MQSCVSLQKTQVAHGTRRSARARGSGSLGPQLPPEELPAPGPMGIDELESPGILVRMRLGFFQPICVRRNI